MQVFLALMERYFCKRSMLMKSCFWMQALLSFFLSSRVMQKYPSCWFDCDVQESKPNSESTVATMNMSGNESCISYICAGSTLWCGSEQMLIRPWYRAPMFMHMLLYKTNWCMSYEHCSDCVVNAYVDWLERNCLCYCAVFWYVSGCDLFIVCIYETLKSAFWKFFLYIAASTQTRCDNNCYQVEAEVLVADWTGKENGKLGD